MSIPSSLANFLTFGDAEVFDLKFVTIKFDFLLLFSDDVFSTITGLSVSFFDLKLSFFISKLSIVCNSNILSPSETLSPTFILSDKTFPSNVDGISTLDLSLSIVINGSFFLLPDLF